MAMSADFLTAFAKLPSQQQRQVRTMIGRFERDSRSSGLNYEKIAGAMDPNMRSNSASTEATATIVLKPDEGNIHVLLWADKHDDAYQWATRHSCSVNSETGALQVYQPRQAVEQAPEPLAADEPGIFGQLKRRELLRLGVPARMVSEVLGIRDEADLEEMAPRLPVEAYEALFLYMAGETYEQIHPRARNAIGAGGHRRPRGPRSAETTPAPGLSSSRTTVSSRRCSAPRWSAGGCFCTISTPPGRAPV